MPGTGHSGRYKGSISNRNTKSSFQVLAPWNAKKNGEKNQVAVSTGGNNLNFKLMGAKMMSNYNDASNAWILDCSLVVLGNKIVTGDVIIDGNVDICGNVTIDKTLDVKEKATFEDVDICGNLRVWGKVTDLSDVDICGNLNANTGEFTGLLNNTGDGSGNGIITRFLKVTDTAYIKTGDIAHLIDVSDNILTLGNHNAATEEEVRGIVAKYIHTDGSKNAFFGMDPSFNGGLVDDVHGQFVFIIDVSENIGTIPADQIGGTLGRAAFGTLDISGSAMYGGGGPDTGLPTQNIVDQANCQMHLVGKTIIACQTPAGGTCSSAQLDISGGIDVVGPSRLTDLSGALIDISGGNIDISGGDVNGILIHTEPAAAATTLGDIKIHSHQDVILIAEEDINIRGGVGQDINIGGGVEVILINGAIVDISGSTVDISGSTVDISGETTTIDASTALNIGPVGTTIAIGNSSATVDISGLTVDISGGTVKVTSTTSDVELIGAHDVTIQSIANDVVILAAQNFEATGSTNVLVTASTGFVNVTGAGGVNIAAAAAGINIGGGATTVDISGATSVDISGGTTTLDAGGTLKIGPVGTTIAIGNSSATVDISGLTVDISGGTVKVTSTTSDVELIGASGVNIAAAAAGINIGGGATTVDISGGTSVKLTDGSGDYIYVEDGEVTIFTGIGGSIDIGNTGGAVGISSGTTTLDASIALNIGQYTTTTIAIGNSNATVDISGSTVDISGGTVKVTSTTSDVELIGAHDATIQSMANDVVILAAQNFEATGSNVKVTASTGFVNIAALTNINIGGGASIVDISGSSQVLLGVGTSNPSGQIKLTDGSGAYIDMGGGKIDISGDDVTITSTSGTSLNLRGPKINIGETGGTVEIQGNVKVDAAVTFVIEDISATNIDVGGNTRIHGPLFALDVSGTLGQVLSSTGTGIEWVDGTTVGSHWNVDSDGIHNTSKNVGIGKDSSNNVALDVSGNMAVSGNLTVNGGTIKLDAHNTAWGYQALQDNISGEANTATGYQALKNNISGYNTATGAGALLSNIDGSGNVATGFQALFNNNSSFNSAFGYKALEQNIDSSWNVATGAYALQNNTGTGNVATGYQALQTNTIGQYNVATGYQALLQLDTVEGNTATGAFALQLNTDGSFNTATGFSALNATTGSHNTAIGAAALYANTIGQYNVAIGDNAGAGQTDISNTINIGTGTSCTTPNTACIGNADISCVYLGSTSGNAKLDCSGVVIGTQGITLDGDGNIAAGPGDWGDITANVLCGRMDISGQIAADGSESFNLSNDKILSSSVVLVNLDFEDAVGIPIFLTTATTAGSTTSGILTINIFNRYNNLISFNTTNHARIHFMIINPST